MNESIEPGEGKLLKASEVARRLNISRSLAYRLIQQNLIPSVRINQSVRVQPADVEEYIRRHYQGWETLCNQTHDATFLDHGIAGMEV
jgi:excisionase family DNA binding protein